MATEAARVPRAAGRRSLSDSALGKLFLTPSVAWMLLVALFPVVYAFVLSLYTYTGRVREGLAGLENYTDALGDDRFWQSVIATLVFTVASVVAEFAIGLGFALIMRQPFRGRGVTRASILVPWVIPTVISAQMWFFMFNVTPGFWNSVLGIGDFNWLGQNNWAMFTIVFTDVWKTAPFVALLLLAGLQTIPEEIYESGRVDGATAWQRFWHLTLPLLRPAILVALLFRTVDSLRVFDLPYVMTNGAFGTKTLSILVQEYVVRTPNPGFGAALSTLTFILVLGVGIIFVRFLGREFIESTAGG
jgi:multiple sugar transport system permease protein